MRNGGDPVNRMPSAARMAPRAAHTSRRLVQIVHSRRTSSEPRGTGARLQPHLRQAALAQLARAPIDAAVLDKSDQRHVVAALGEMPGTHLHVLPDRAEIRRQPVGNDDDPPLGRRIERTLLQQLASCRARLPSIADR